MKAKKWNYKTRKYEPFTLPSNACLLSEDMEQIIQCANCEKEIKFGECYTSLTIHTDNILAFGYAVCEDCYKVERKEKQS
ncbi:MAG: hypothetical protein BWX85_01095 [Chloroflexi bacterium ADurb.Bin120]|jgi:hypothetical protein|nr:MAG: hypothetical protein BWX85_01095 [Chloroflexi bacterium ADurb.Bin120]